MLGDSAFFTIDLGVLETFLGDFQKLTEEKYLVEERVNEAAIIIRNTKEPKLTLKVVLTSPLIRDEAEKKDGGTWRAFTSVSGWFSEILQLCSSGLVRG